MARRGETLEVSGGVLVGRVPGAEAGVARLASRLAELRGVRELDGIVEVLGETEIRIETFEKPGEPGDVGPGPRQHDHAGRSQVRRSGLRAVDGRVDGGEAVRDDSPHPLEQFRCSPRVTFGRLQRAPFSVCAAQEKISPFAGDLHGFGERPAKSARVAARADGSQSFDLDLPRPLLRDPEHLGDLAEGAGLLAVETVAHPEDLGLALWQGTDGLDERLLPLADLDAGVVVAAPLVRQKVSHLGAVLVAGSAYPGVDARDGLANLAEAPGILGPGSEPLGELFLGGVAPELDAQRVLGPALPIQRVHDVGRESDGTGLVGDGAGDGLPYPPGSVRREAVAHLGVELLDGPDQARVALLDQIFEGHAATPVLLGDGDHQPQVRLDEPLSGTLLALMGAPAEVALLAGVEQPASADLAKVLCENVLCLHHPVSPFPSCQPVSRQLSASFCSDDAPFRFHTIRRTEGWRTRQCQLCFVFETAFITPPDANHRPAARRASRTGSGSSRPGST